MNLEKLYALSYIGGGNLASKEAAGNNLLTRRLLKALQRKAMGMGNKATLQSELQNAYKWNDKVLDRYYRMYNSYNKRQFRNVFNDINPNTLLPRNTRVNFAAPKDYWNQDGLGNLRNMFGMDGRQAADYLENRHHTLFNNFIRRRDAYYNAAKARGFDTTFN